MARNSSNLNFLESCEGRDFIFLRSATWICDRWGSPLFETENYEEEKTCDNKQRNNNNNNNNLSAYFSANTAVLLVTIWSMFILIIALNEQLNL